MRNLFTLHHFLLLLIIILGFLLRSNNLFVWPRVGATFDEYAWTWQGMNLIQKGTPISWSPLPAYTNFEQIKYQTVPFRIVTPFLEHPPLFGLVAGSFAIITGARNMYDLTVYNIRPLALVLGTLSIYLVYLLSSKFYNKSIGLLSALLYSTIPTVVVGSRILQNENFFIPVWLLSLYLVKVFLDSQKKLFAYSSIILCSLLILAKIPWGAASLSLIMIFLFHKSYKLATFTILGGITSLIIYALYGMHYDWNLFTRLIIFQSNRYDITFDSIFALFQKPYLVDRFYNDGWILFGWVSVLTLAFTNFKKNYLIIFAFLSYFLVFIAGIPDEPGHGWYRYPFYPFLVISIAVCLKEYFVKNPIFTFLFLSLVGSSLLANTWQVALGFSYVIYRICILSWAYPLAPLFIKPGKLVRLSFVVSYFWLIIFIFLNILSIILYNEQ